MKKLLTGFLAIGIAVMVMPSCSDVKQLQYMQGSFDTAKLSKYTIPDPVIQIGDLLSITVYSDNPANTAIFNQSMGVAANPGANSQVGSAAGNLTTPIAPGYLVDNDGNINFQQIGRLHVVGLTKKQLAALLDSKLDTFLTHPYYNIRFMNFKVTILGDVAHPSVYSIPIEKINILEAIGLAGDLNVTANRSNVLVVREQNGTRSFGRLDLKSPEIFTSPYFQLQQNDVVYVDLTKTKAAANDQTLVRNITIGTSILATIALYLNLFK